MTFLFLLCVASICFCIQNMDGPFQVLNWLRNLIAKIPFIGPTFFKILNCNFCLGFWVTVFCTLIMNIGSSHTASIRDLIINGFAGAGFNMLFQALTNRYETNVADSVTVKFPSV